MKKYLFYPALWGVFLILLFYGCRTNDEAIKTERQIQGAEYSSKTLWSEDEKYIKNIIKIYDHYKETVNKNSSIKGEPFWDYAMTMGQFNESYLEVPIVNQEKVVQILRVIRKGSKVYFGSNSEERISLDFFQQLIFGKYATIKGEEERNGKVQNTGNGALADGQYICTTRKISMWYPDDNNNPDGSGHWETSYESRCLWVEQEKTDIIVPCVGPGCDGAGDPGGGTPGFPYPEPEIANDACSKMKAQRENLEFNNRITNLKGKTSLKKETGYTQNGSTGDWDYQDNANATETANSLRLPDAKQNNIKSYSHTHVDDYKYTDSDGNEIIRTGIKMFSPADLSYLMDMLENAKSRGINFLDVSGTMVTSLGTYTMRFTGNEYQLKSFTETQISGFTEPYKTFMTDNSNLSLEQKFLQFADSKMNVKGLQLFKLNDDGTTTKTELNSDKASVTTSNCP
ncbi:hypothetical protein [Elizabethkingia ursingii]|uniref:hypothetical protein n=1 Tax=Elizabethkingia ursingii TaxID=1756150 RepID=UPI0020139926|nr:hypothetical protein [Elizabethkingia ursingii]MCL1672193.1 hypothetical protein [Elizabethkingia ursingii]